MWRNSSEDCRPNRRAALSALCPAEFIVGFFSKTLQYPRKSDNYKLVEGSMGYNFGIGHLSRFSIILCILASKFRAITLKQSFILNFKFGQRQSCSGMLGLKF